MAATGSIAMPRADRFKGLDHLRALAIVLVFMYHYRMFGELPGLQAVSAFGWTGVDLFFVLSGYLVGGQLLNRLAQNKSIDYASFYIKRSLRILPAYLVVLILYFCIPAFTERSTLPPLWRFLTFTQNFGLDLGLHGAFSHAWSLCIEEQFYLLLPVLVLAFAYGPFKKKAIWILAVFFLLGFACRAYSWFHFLQPFLTNPEQPEGFGPAYYKWIYYPTYNRLDGLLAGVALAALFHFKPLVWARITRYGQAWLFLGIVLTMAAWFVCYGDRQYTAAGAIWGYPLVSLAYGVVVLAALSPVSILYRYGLKLTEWLATLSYAIYLTHKQLIHLTHIVLEKQGWADGQVKVFWICVAVSLAGALALHLAVEKPFLMLRDFIVKKTRS